MKLQIVNWRAFGDDEAYCRVEVLDKETDLLDVIQSELSEEEKENWRLGTGESEGHSFYVNDDFSFWDCEEIKGIDGKRYRIRIEGVS
jgi:hypothetical protein